MSHEYEISAPSGTRILLVTFPDDASEQTLTDSCRMVERRLAEAAANDAWPVVLALQGDAISIRWLEAETPAPVSPKEQKHQ